MGRAKYVDLTVCLVRADDIKGWAAFIPEIDVVTQGDTALNAVGMAMDAARIVIEDSLSASRFTDDGEVERKRVVSPTRNSLSAETFSDEEWYRAYVAYKDGDRASGWGNPAHISGPELDSGTERVALAHIGMIYMVVGGVLFINAGEFYPDPQFMVKGTDVTFNLKVRQRMYDYGHQTHVVRASLIEAGADPANLIGHDDDDHEVTDVKVVR